VLPLYPSEKLLSPRSQAERSFCSASSLKPEGIRKRINFNPIKFEFRSEKVKFL
jgi:hypothetical protein